MTAKPNNIEKEEFVPSHFNPLTDEEKQNVKVIEPINYQTEDFEDKSREAEDVIEENQFGAINHVGDQGLMTNIEEYSNKIRKEADDYFAAKKEEADKIIAEANRLAEEAKKQKEDAEADKEKAIAETQQNVDAIEAAANEKGFQEGYQSGQQKAEEDARHYLTSIQNLIEEIKKQKEELVIRNEEEIIELAKIIARKVIFKEVSVSKESLKRGLQKTLSSIDQVGMIKIRVNTGDYEYIKSFENDLLPYLEDDQKISIKVDDEVQSPGAIIDTEFSQIDLQLKELLRQLDDQLANTLSDRQVKFKSREQAE